MNIMHELQERLEKAGSQAALARELNVSQPYLSNVLAGRAEPGPLVLEAMGIEKVVTYQYRRKQAQADG